MRASSSAAPHTLPFQRRPREILRLISRTGNYLYLFGPSRHFETRRDFGGMSDNVFIDVVEPIDPTLLAPSEKELERWWARQNRAGKGTGGGFDFNSIGTSGSDRGSDSDASDCGGLTLREAQQLVGKRRAEHPGRLDERFGSGMRVKTKLPPLSATPLSAIPGSPIRRTREDSASSAEGTMDPSPRSPLDRAAARDAALDLVGSPKRGRPATTAPTLTPATSSSRAGNDASYASSRTPVPSIDELAPTTSTSSDGGCVDLETGVREIIARETPVASSDIALGSSALERLVKRGMDRKIPKPVWTAVGLLWLYAIMRLILGA